MARVKETSRIPQETLLSVDLREELIPEISDHSFRNLLANFNSLCNEVSHSRTLSLKKFQAKRTSFLSKYQDQLKMTVISNTSPPLLQNVIAQADPTKVHLLL